MKPNLTSRHHVMDGQWTGVAQLTRLTSANNSTTLQIKVSIGVYTIQHSDGKLRNLNRAIPVTHLFGDMENWASGERLWKCEFGTAVPFLPQVKQRAIFTEKQDTLTVLGISVQIIINVIALVEKQERIFSLSLRNIELTD
ncbi:uncharacterized protein V6R79_013099 [Siganus canaliculatus]